MFVRKTLSLFLGLMFCSQINCITVIENDVDIEVDAFVNVDGQVDVDADGQFDMPIAQMDLEVCVYYLEDCSGDSCAQMGHYGLCYDEEVDTDGDGNTDLITSWTTDEEGNPVKKTKWKGAFDASGNLVSEEIWEWTYDTEGNILSSKYTKRTFDERGFTVEEIDVDGDGTIDVINIYDEDGNLVHTEGSSTDTSDSSQTSPDDWTEDDH